jgi:hypothetical protein
MKFFKVVNEIRAETEIDTNKSNYSLTLNKENDYRNLLNFVTHSSKVHNLPLDVYFSINNNLARRGNKYLESFPKSRNGIFEIIDFTKVAHHKNMFIKESTVIEIVKTLDDIGISEFMEGYYLWEYIYEKVRDEKHWDKPKRSESLFLFENLNDCEYYITTHKGGGEIAIVEVLENRFLFKADMNLLDLIPNYFTNNQAEEVANRYWSGMISDKPIMEILFQGKCLIKPI